MPPINPHISLSPGPTSQGQLNSAWSFLSIVHACGIESMR